MYIAVTPMKKSIMMYDVPVSMRILYVRRTFMLYSSRGQQRVLEWVVLISWSDLACVMYSTPRSYDVLGGRDRPKGGV